MHPPWQTLYRWFRRWQRDGTWVKVLAGLQAAADAAGQIDWTVSIDSTVSRAHQHAAGARRDAYLQKEPPGGVQSEPDDHGLGRSRGDFTAKTHLACEQDRKALAIVITAGQRGDSPQFVIVLEQIKVYRIGGGRPRTRPDDLLLADKAYTSQPRQSWLRPPPPDPSVYPEQGRPGRAPQGQRVQRRAAARLRPARVPATSSRPPWRPTPCRGRRLIGGVQRAGRLGVGLTLVIFDWDTVRASVETLRAAAYGAGHDPDTLPVILQVNGNVTAEPLDERGPLIGSPEQVAADLDQAARLGIEHIYWNSDDEPLRQLPLLGQLRRG